MLYGYVLLHGIADTDRKPVVRCRRCAAISHLEDTESYLSAVTCWMCNSVVEPTPRGTNRSPDTLVSSNSALRDMSVAISLTESLFPEAANPELRLGRESNSTWSKGHQRELNSSSRNRSRSSDGLAAAPISKSTIQRFRVRIAPWKCGGTEFCCTICAQPTGRICGTRASRWPAWKRRRGSNRWIKAAAKGYLTGCGLNPCAVSFS